MSRAKTVDIKNGIGRPVATSRYGQVWLISDKIYEVCPDKLRATVLEECIRQGIDKSTASVAHCRWRKYNGLVTRGIK